MHPPAQSAADSTNAEANFMPLRGERRVAGGGRERDDENMSACCELGGMLRSRRVAGTGIGYAMSVARRKRSQANAPGRAVRGGPALAPASNPVTLMLQVLITDEVDGVA